MTLDGLEARRENSREPGGELKMSVVRYAVDFIITGTRKSGWNMKSGRQWLNSGERGLVYHQKRPG
jgi:hypothetical protein